MNIPNKRWIVAFALLLGLLLAGCEATTFSTPRYMPVFATGRASANTLTISSVMGTGEASYTADGQAPLQTALYNPMDLTFGPDNTLYVIDWNNHCVRRVTSANLVDTYVWTCSVPGDAGPPGPANKALVNHPTHLIIDPQGRLVSATWHSSRVIRVNLQTGILEFVCGTGARSFAGDGGPCATAILDLPSSVAFDSRGNMFISDQSSQRIRRMDGQGVITTVVGTGQIGYSGDGGPASQATLNNPVGQAADPAGRIVMDRDDNLYIADSGNHAIRKVTPDGMITTIAGTGVAGYTGDGGPAAVARLNGPRDLEFGPDGSLYVADTMNHCVRKIAAGVISTVAGTCGQQGYDGDGGPAAQALMDRPYGIAFDRMGTLHVADSYNNRIRVVR